ncbi:MAG: box helicase domain protein [Verrucomicrobia bacterium]|nr:box helicase domain protein [Verrucomicrobiota bacterium]
MKSIQLHQFTRFPLLFPRPSTYSLATVPATLYDLIPRDENLSNEALLGKFLEYAEGRRLQLYAAQESAILELFEEKNVILNTPTGSGKSLVAAALHFKAIALGHRSIYTCPIKALVNEKFMALCREFGPENVGLSTGDATVNHDAPILCCTAEILANIALAEGPAANVREVIMDEFHYYADRERGVAWQIPLLTLPQARFLLMSATLGETAFFEEELTKINGRPSVTISSVERPVPLEFAYSELPLSKTLESLVADGKAPVYVVHFTQLEAAQSAQDFTSINVCSKDEKAAIANAIEGFKFTSPYGPDIKKWLRHGIGLHHAGLLPKYRILIEQLAQRGLLKVICGTDTLGVGINVPIRTVLFTRLCKFDGQKTGILSARDFHQVSGRAGRKGFDDLGWVVAQAPEHVIENLKLAEKSARDGKKVTKRQPPEKNFVNWDKNTFLRLIAAPPERLTSRFQVSHGMLLNVLSRKGDGCAAMRDLIRRSHETPKAKKTHTARAWQLFRSLLDRKIIEFITPEQAQAPGQKLRVNITLQEDFSMDQVLSLYLLDTIPLMDPQAPDYALVLLTLVESILENPDIILRKQLDRVKDQKMAEMKMEGIEYDKRMEELEKCEYPKPNREFVYTTFNAFADKHPWVGQENIRPKSIVREMFEEFRSFADYIKLYELQRAEGVLLRHINSVFKVLAQTVPDTAKNDQVREMEAYLSTMIKQVDSSLLDEWEKMRNPDYQRAESKEVRPPGAEEAARDITRDTKAFTASIRTRIFSFLRGLVNGDFETALPLLAFPDDSEGVPWTNERLHAAIEAYFAVHGHLRLDPEARNARHTYVVPSEDKRTWRIQQMLIDADGHNDWVAEFVVDLTESRAKEEPALRLIRIGALA